MLTLEAVAVLALAMADLAVVELVRTHPQTAVAVVVAQTARLLVDQAWL
jgi:hypothetical protein